ncbi:MAG: hypothetical protein WDN25_30640 [Acetobacteraceae bacterium]
MLRRTAWEVAIRLGASPPVTIWIVGLAVRAPPAMVGAAALPTTLRPDLLDA